MVSRMMLDDAADLEAKGVILTPREVVRLNALGLKAEKGQSAAALFHLRRICRCGDIVFHEPTIGHYEWIERAEALMDLDDSETWFIVRSFWLSVMDPRDLPRLDDIDAIKNAVNSFASGKLCSYTVAQVRAGIEYVINGCCAETGENAPARHVSEDDVIDDSELNDWCSEIGVVREAQALGLGISLQDARSMTHSQLRAVVDRAYASRAGSDGDKDRRNDAIGDYNAALSVIVASHEVNENG